MIHLQDKSARTLPEWARGGFSTVPDDVLHFHASTRRRKSHGSRLEILQHDWSHATLPPTFQGVGPPCRKVSTEREQRIRSRKITTSVHKKLLKSYTTRSLLNNIARSRYSMTMSLHFNGQTILITGVCQGLGPDYARYFARLGANVVVHDGEIEVSYMLHGVAFR
jgi:hypothetical protein